MSKNIIYGLHIDKGIRPIHIAIEEDIKHIKKICGVCDVVQFFVVGPQNLHPTIHPDEYDDVKKISVMKIIHGAYVGAPWNNAPGSLHCIHMEMEIAMSIGAAGIIVHLGKNTISNLGVINRFIPGKVGVGGIPRTFPVIYLEINSTKPGPNSFETPAKLRALFAAAALTVKREITLGLVIDTAHLYACGINIADSRVVDKWIAEITSVIKEYKIPVILHLNDCKTPLGCGKDIHAYIGAGLIWRSDTKTLGMFIEFAKKNNCPIILERSGYDRRARPQLRQRQQPDAFFESICGDIHEICDSVAE